MSEEFNKRHGKLNTIKGLIKDGYLSDYKPVMIQHRKELISQVGAPMHMDDWRDTVWISKNALIITDVEPYENGDRVQFMYWPNQWSVYANDIYYQPTLGLDGII